MLCPPRQLPGQVTITSAVSVPLPLEQQTTLTWGYKVDNPAYNNNMLDLYKSVTACGQPNFRGAHLRLPSNFDFHAWSAIAHTQADEEGYNIWSMDTPQFFFLFFF